MLVLLWLSVVIASGVYICGPIQDPDLGWHVTVGRWILGNRQIPTVDHWTMFGSGDVWRAYSWSNEIIYALFDAAGGIEGLLVLKLILAVSIAFSLLYVLGSIAEDNFIGSLLGMYATAACFDHFTLRPQSLVWVYFIVLIGLCDRISRDGLSFSRGFALCAVMALWANTHITTILGLIVIAAWLFRAGQMQQTLGALLLAFGGTFITPYFGAEWLTFLGKLSHPFQHTTIAEFTSASLMQYSTSFLLVLAVLLLVFVARVPTSLGVWKTMLAIAFIAGGLLVVKFLPLAVILLAALVADIWGRDENKLGNLAVGLKKLRALFFKLSPIGLSFLFVVSIILNTAHLWKRPVAHPVMPVYAVDFIKAQDLPYPILNTFDSGGYLMYRMSNRRGELRDLVSIDGRTNVGPPELWEKFHASYRGEDNWQELFDLVNPKTVLWTTDSPLSSILQKNANWCLVFRSGSERRGFQVFVRRDQFLERQDELKAENC